ncbi:alpha/beta fold hydrolase [Caldimonas sp. KR1-144]|uniref:alpha/beta fold hydrolase n=1 Tax=Caldimonas sp. KR1-144 TaxID=3400911 RepID=UPI003C08B6F2
MADALNAAVADAVANYYARRPAVTWLGRGLAAVQALRPAAATRLAARLFFTPLPAKWRAARAPVPPGWRVESLAFERGRLALFRPEADTAGPPVLLLHGWGGAAQQMLPIARALAAAGARPWLLDWPAHGRSSGWRASLPQFVRVLDYLLARLADELGSTPAVAAHSLGALAAAAAAGRGAPVSRLVLLAPSPPPEPVLRGFARGVGLDDAAQRRLRRHIEASEGLLLDGFEPQRLGQRLALPTLIVHDRDDRMAPLEVSRRLAAHAAGAELLVTESLGHLRLLEHAGVAETVRDFVVRPRVL